MASRAYSNKWIPRERKYIRTYLSGAELTKGSSCAPGGFGGCSGEPSTALASMPRSQLAAGEDVPCGTLGVLGITSSALAGPGSSVLLFQLASLQVHQLLRQGFGPVKKKKKRVHCSIGNENKITDTVCSPLSLNRHERASLCSPFTLGFPAHGPVSFCAPLTRGSLGRLQPPHSRWGLQLPASGRQIWHSSKTISGMKTNYFTKSSLEAWWNRKAGKKLFFGKKVHLKRLLSYTFFFKPCRRNTCLEAFKLCTLIAFSKRGEYGAESCF